MKLFPDGICWNVSKKGECQVKGKEWTIGESKVVYCDKCVNELKPEIRAMIREKKDV